ncbi:hypothetical protein AVEN_74862-1 [Araneus ventricosus]|uniref:Uncharacterized protein n=1 Tax=Araneus ventricosus TaxID=182803 RepID=A0A4Y2T882_ARAVE|nr:hypothetical protein AVEN_257812-1 [Araneus ventricosus]GBN96845.1 hypothetical protein AVEN_74862-1 [Araneus ventricosus]
MIRPVVRQKPVNHPSPFLSIPPRNREFGYCPTAKRKILDMVAASRRVEERRKGQFITFAFLNLALKGRVYCRRTRRERLTPMDLAYTRPMHIAESLWNPISTRNSPVCHHENSSQHIRQRQLC